MRSRGGWASVVAIAIWLASAQPVLAERLYIKVKHKKKDETPPADPEPSAPAAPAPAVPLPAPPAAPPPPVAPAPASAPTPAPAYAAPLSVIAPSSLPAITATPQPAPLPSVLAPIGGTISPLRSLGDTPKAGPAKAAAPPPRSAPATAATVADRRGDPIMAATAPSIAPRLPSRKAVPADPFERSGPGGTPADISVLTEPLEPDPNAPAASGLGFLTAYGGALGLGVGLGDSGFVIRGVAQLDFWRTPGWGLELQLTGGAALGSSNIPGRRAFVLAPMLVWQWPKSYGRLVAALGAGAAATQVVGNECPDPLCGYRPNSPWRFQPAATGHVGAWLSIAGVDMGGLLLSTQVFRTGNVDVLLDFVIGFDSFTPEKPAPSLTY